MVVMQNILFSLLERISSSGISVTEDPQTIWDPFDLIFIHFII